MISRTTTRGPGPSILCTRVQSPWWGLSGHFLTRPASRWRQRPGAGVCSPEGWLAARVPTGHTGRPAASPPACPAPQRVCLSPHSRLPPPGPDPLGLRRAARSPSPRVEREGSPAPLRGSHRVWISGQSLGMLSGPHPSLQGPSVGKQPLDGPHPPLDPLPPAGSGTRCCPSPPPTMSSCGPRCPPWVPTCQRAQPVHLGILQQGVPLAVEGDRGGQGGVEEGGREGPRWGGSTDQPG